jgi:hypothetical protein
MDEDELGKKGVSDLLARVAKEELRTLGPVDYARALPAPGRPAPRGRLGLPVGIAAALVAGIGIGSAFGALLWAGPAGARDAPSGAWGPESARYAVSETPAVTGSAEASLREEVDLFVAELLGSGEVEDAVGLMDLE